MDKDEYYIQRVPSGYLGNALIWWAVGNNGYTAYVQNAKRFTKDEAIKLIRNDGKYAMFKCDEVDKRLHLVFDMQDINRLGTEEGCDFNGGKYALRESECANEIQTLRAKVASAEVLVEALSTIRHSAYMAASIDPTVGEIFRVADKAIMTYDKLSEVKQICNDFPQAKCEQEQGKLAEAVAEVKIDCFGLKDIVWNAHHWAHILQVGDKLYKTPPSHSEELERLKAENNILNDAIIEDKIFIADYNRLKAQNEKMYQALKCIDEDLVNPVHYILVKEAIVDYERQQSL